MKATGRGGQKKKVKGWKEQVGGGFDHQFFENTELDRLEKKYNLWIEYEGNTEEWGEKEVPDEFTDDDQAQLDQLLQEGFVGWNKRHFFQFINMCELYGRDNCDLYTVLMTEGGKTSEEIQRYSDTFWQKYKQVDNFKKYIDRIEKGEAEIEKRNQIAEAIDGKWSQLITKFKAKDPEASISDFTFQDIEIKYEKEQEVDFEQNPFEFYPDEDKFYAFGLFKYTYGYWELMRNDLRNAQCFLFNWVVLSRSVLDIQRRCDFLVSQFQAELSTGTDARKQKAPPKSKKNLELCPEEELDEDEDPEEEQSRNKKKIGGAKRGRKPKPTAKTQATKRKQRHGSESSGYRSSKKKQKASAKDNSADGSPKDEENE